MLDEKGNMLTGSQEIQNRAIEVYSGRLKGNKIKKHLKRTEILKEKLCEERL